MKTAIITKAPKIHGDDIETIECGVDAEDAMIIMDMLADLYSRKEEATIREIACNAMDANVAAGNEDKPIIVTLPTKQNPVMVIKDSGTGLSHMEVKTLYSRFGKSTKREGNKAQGQTGCLGIGKFAPLCYTNSFNITTIHNGYKGYYTMVKPPQILRTHYETTTEENGLEISVPVKQDQVDNFVTIMARVFSSFRVKPEITNITDSYTTQLDSRDLFREKGFIFEDESFIIRKRDNSYSNLTVNVWMSNILYPVQLGMLSSEAKAISDTFTDLEIVIKVKPSEVDFTPNREDLKYSDKTKAKLNNYLPKLKNLFFKYVQDEMNNTKDAAEAVRIFNTSMTVVAYRARKHFQETLLWQGKYPVTTLLEGYSSFYVCPKDFPKQFKEIPSSLQTSYIINGVNQGQKIFFAFLLDHVGESFEYYEIPKVRINKYKWSFFSSGFSGNAAVPYDSVFFVTNDLTVDSEDSNPTQNKEIKGRVNALLSSPDYKFGKVNIIRFDKLPASAWTTFKAMVTKYLAFLGDEIFETQNLKNVTPSYEVLTNTNCGSSSSNATGLNTKHYYVFDSTMINEKGNSTSRFWHGVDVDIDDATKEKVYVELNAFKPCNIGMEHVYPGNSTPSVQQEFFNGILSLLKKPDTRIYGVKTSQISQVKDKKHWIPFDKFVEKNIKTALNKTFTEEIKLQLFITTYINSNNAHNKGCNYFDYLVPVDKNGKVKHIAHTIPTCFVPIVKNLHSLEPVLRRLPKSHKFSKLVRVFVNFNDMYNIHLTSIRNINKAINYVNVIPNIKPIVRNTIDSLSSKTYDNLCVQLDDLIASYNFIPTSKCWGKTGFTIDYPDVDVQHIPFIIDGIIQMDLLRK